MENTKLKAQEYMDKGMVPTPVQNMGKKPLLSKWQDTTINTAIIQANFNGNQNIGIVLGKASGGLVDIDLDCPEAVRMADQFLPNTGMIFGRDSSPCSHWIYRSTECGDRVAFQGPGDEGMLVEYRGNGAQTVFPESTHETGEVIKFTTDGEPGQVDDDDLMKRVRHLAAASLIARHWVSGKRHETALALSGTLLRSGWFDDDVVEFIQAICTGANDIEVQDRLQAVQDTSMAIEGGDASTGLPRLKQLIGDAVVDRVVEWLELDRPDRIGSNSQAANDNVLRCSDIGNAEVFANQHRHHLRYCFDLGAWLAWNKTYWRIDDKAKLDQLPEQTVRTFPEEAKTVVGKAEAQELLEWAVKSGKRSNIKAMVEQSRYRVQIDQDKLDADPMLINAGGTVINLKDGTSRPCKPEDYATKITTIKFDHRAECPQFMAFLDKIMGSSKELIGYLQRAAGYSLTASTSEQCFFIAHGSGANGKSVFLNLLRDMMGSYAMGMAMDSLMAKQKSGGIPNDIARLYGARMVTATEGEEDQVLAQSLIKQLTGGDKMTARYLFKEFFDFEPELKLWMATNHKPKVSGDDSAIWRRIHLIPFNVVIPAEEQDGDLPKKLREEMPGILNWAIQGAVEWSKSGLMPPSEVVDAIQGYKSEMDMFSTFCADIIIKQPGVKTTKVDVYHAYQHWRFNEGGEELSKQQLTGKMKRHGYEDVRGTGGSRCWKDVELATSLLD